LQLQPSEIHRKYTSIEGSRGIRLAIFGHHASRFVFLVVLTVVWGQGSVAVVFGVSGARRARNPLESRGAQLRVRHLLLYWSVMSEYCLFVVEIAHVVQECISGLVLAGITEPSTMHKLNGRSGRRSTLRKGIANVFSKATAFCNAPTRVNSAPAFHCINGRFCKPSGLVNDYAFSGPQSGHFSCLRSGQRGLYISSLGSGMSPLLCCSPKHTDWFLTGTCALAMAPSLRLMLRDAGTDAFQGSVGISINPPGTIAGFYLADKFAILVSH